MDILTVTEAAVESGLTGRAIRKALENKRLKGERKSGGWIIKRTDFDKWMANERAHRRGPKGN